MFLVTLLTIANSRKHPKRPSTDEWINIVWVWWNIFSLGKEGGPDTRYGTHGPEGHMLNKPLTKGQVLCDPTYTRSVEISNS